MVAFSSSAHGATDTWTNASGGLWATGGNWSTGNPPLTGDDATNPLIALITFNTTAAVDSFTTAGAFTISGGTLSGTQANAASPVTLAGLFTFSGGTLASATTTANGGIDFHGGGETIQDGGSLTNASGQNATIGATGAIDVGLEDGATFTNAGTLTGSGSAQIFFNNSGAAGTVANSGTFDVTGSFTIGAGLIFNNTGAVNVQAATLVLSAADSAATSGTFSVSSGATLKFNNNYTLLAASGVSGAGTVNFSSGTTNVDGTYNISGTSTFSGGNVNFNSTITNLGSGPVLVSGGTINFGSNTLTLTSLNISAGKVATTTGTLTSSGLLTFSGGTLAARPPSPTAALISTAGARRSRTAAH